MPLSHYHLAPVPSLASIAVGGADAERYLAAQLSQIPPGRGSLRAPLAAWHDAKGRVQALFRVLRHADGFLLLTHSSVAADVTEALRRYVLRAQVSLEIAAAQDAVVAIVGDCAEWLHEQRIELGTEPGASAEREGTVWVRLGPGLIHLLAPAPPLERLLAQLPTGSSADAELAEIRLGLPVVSAQLRGLFLPQMLNLDLLGGVAFDKGCYPGQEIIARTQNLGSVKRRMQAFAGMSSGPVPMPGSRLVNTARNEVGVVVRAARAGANIELLAVVELAAASGQLLYEQPSGELLSLSAAENRRPGDAGT